MGCRKKTLLVIHMLENNEIELEVSQKFCHSEFPVPYKLIYFPIKFDEKIDHSIFTHASGECDFTLIYLDPNARIGRLMIFLQEIKKFNHMTIYSYTQISKYFIERNGITGVETYLLVPKKTSRIKVEDRVDYKSITFPQQEKTTNRLECQIWFEIYINKAFGCGFGKLFQLSGTCFLNSAICGLFLSNVRLYLIDIFNRLSLDPKFRSKIGDSLSPLICPTFDYSTSKWYIFTLINVLFCRGERHTLAKSTDYLSLAKNMYEDIPGKGSSATFTVLKILNDCMAPCVLKIENSIVNLPYQSFNYQNFVEFVDDPIRREPIQESTDLPEFVLDYYSTFPVVVPMLMTVGLQAYNLQCAFISLDLKDDTLEDRRGHGIVGFFCDNVPKVYDSASNKVLNIDWRNLEFQNGGKKLLKLLDRDPEEFNIYIDSALYSFVDFRKLQSTCGVHKTIFDQWVSERFGV
jgi:hypothetical protein